MDPKKIEHWVFRALTGDFPPVRNVTVLRLFWLVGFILLPSLLLFSFLPVLTWVNFPFALGSGVLYRAAEKWPPRARLGSRILAAIIFLSSFYPLASVPGDLAGAALGWWGWGAWRSTRKDKNAVRRGAQIVDADELSRRVEQPGDKAGDATRRSGDETRRGAQIVDADDLAGLAEDEEK